MLFNVSLDMYWLMSGKSDWYSSYYRHRNNCSYCSPELDEEKQPEMEEKQRQLQAIDDSNITVLVYTCVY